MRTKRMIAGLLFISLALVFCTQPKNHPVYMGTEMSSGYDLGVTSNTDSVGWLSDVTGAMKADFPAGQQWGALFMTVGKIKDLPNKPTVDISKFSILSFELKTEADTCKLEAGIKDDQDPDDGTESRVVIEVYPEWKTYEIALSEFKTADLKRIYMLTELVYKDSTAQTVYIRNVQFK